MKRIYYVLLSFFLSINYCISQIKFSDEVLYSPSINTNYDSLSNFLKGNYNQYIGQTLTIIPSAGEYKKESYSGFIKDPNKSRYSKSNIYSASKKVKSINDGTPYDDLVDRYFEVIDVVKVMGITYLKLQDELNEEIIYFDYKPDYEHTFPFIIKGYFEKQRNLLINKVYYARTSKLNHFSHYTQNTTDILGNEFKADIGSEWEIIDVLAQESNLSSKILLKMRGMDSEIYVVKDLMKEYDVVEKELYEPIKNLYDDDIFNKVLRHLYYIGWDTYLVRLSIGNPNKINTTYSNGAKSEQWVYGDGRYLYFNEGKLTAIQD